MRNQPIADNPKNALEDFLNELIQVYYPWYQNSVKRHYVLSLPVQIVALFAGFATAILAALATEKTFTDYTSVRILLVVLPALGSAATTVAVQSKLFERYQLRENGRLAIQGLYNEGRARFAAATTPADYTAIHSDLVKKVDQIEAQQSIVFFSLAAARTPPAKMK